MQVITEPDFISNTLGIIISPLRVKGGVSHSQTKSSWEVFFKVIIKFARSRSGKAGNKMCFGFIKMSGFINSTWNFSFMFCTVRSFVISLQNYF